LGLGHCLLDALGMGISRLAATVGLLGLCGDSAPGTGEDGGGIADPGGNG
jgi:hypothetical protein